MLCKFLYPSLKILHLKTYLYHIHMCMLLCCLFIRNFSLTKMPVPVNDAGAALKIDQDKTQKALQKVF